MKRVSSLFVIFVLLFMLAGCPSIQTMKDSTLKALLFNSLSVPNFDPEITEYTIELPRGTTEVPTISTVPNIEGVTIEVINAETIPGTTKIIVTALDGETVTTYHIYFAVQKNNDSSLKALEYNAIPVPGFKNDKLNYEVILPAGSTYLPTISATANDPNATITITQVLELPGTAFVTVTAEDAVTASNYSIYFIPQYFIEASSNPSDGGNITGSGNYVHGTQVNLTATANEGYEFIDWTDNGVRVSTNASYSFTANADRALVANFKLKTYTLTATAGVGGTVIPYGIVEVKHGEDKQFTIASDQGCEIKEVIVDGVSVGAVNTYDFDNVTRNHTIHGEFKLKLYTIDVSAIPETGGTVSGGGNFNHGDSVEIIATANTGYEFIGWTENELQVSTDTSYSFTATADRTLVANFRRLTYSITLDVNPIDGGSVSGGGAFLHGEEVTVIATPNLGKYFINWTEDAVEVSKEPVYTFVATKDCNLVANFEMNHAPEFDKLLPVNGAVNQPVDVKLEWNAVDTNGATVTYDVYFGYSSANLIKVMYGTTLEEYYPDVIKGFTFYWRVVASNGSVTTDSGVIAFSTVEEVLTDKSVHIIDNLLDKQPSDPATIAVQVRGIGIVAGSELAIEIDTNYMEFLNRDGHTLSEFLASNPEATFADFEPWCEYKAISTDFLSIMKLKDTTGSTVYLSGAYKNSAGKNIADGNLWFIYVKVKAITGRTAAVFSSVSFVDTALVEIPVDSSDQGLFIVK
ncbi:hypothetical protein V512_014415 [Mesotoga sp. Brook.08.105.5.1]|uniref:InlB B-repeat-containing protein n=3 Tax=unclassified Mesotoga TaxID=1184398 RepID=UPI000C177895|nr:InlB B-repeat-containing protein [Mesotoga sp. Brook.08.105.5.1]PVD18063.1 hypothetical protein V512_014415 [Mesotoga sp. Brook.08.105.5.1]RAM58111.1 hypothetical protein DS65_00860 [Mesotoga sp. SC_4PWL113PWK15]